MHIVCRTSLQSPTPQLNSALIILVALDPKQIRSQASYLSELGLVQMAQYLPGSVMSWHMEKPLLKQWRPLVYEPQLLDPFIQ